MPLQVPKGLPLFLKISISVTVFQRHSPKSFLKISPPKSFPKEDLFFEINQVFA